MLINKGRRFGRADDINTEFFMVDWQNSYSYQGYLCVFLTIYICDYAAIVIMGN
jgi:hypothetical protein